MSDPPSLTEASHADLVSALAYGLRFDPRGKAHRQASELAAHIAAETLARHLAQSGFVVMRRPPAQAPSTPPDHTSTDSASPDSMVLHSTQPDR